MKKKNIKQNLKNTSFQKDFRDFHDTILIPAEKFLIKELR